METLIISKQIGGETVRYTMEVTKEVMARYVKMRKEHPKLTPWEAYQKAAENQ